MGWWVGISNRGNWWSTAETTTFGGKPFIPNKYKSRTRFEVILGSIR